jgi:outer membrane receptor protein involved in Fe transport
VEEVVVQTSRYSLVAENAGSRTFLTQDQVESMPRLADETLRAVQRLPGSATNGFSSVGSVRGGEPNETAIVLDGLRLYEPFHLKNFLSPISLLDSRLIDGIEFYSGGFPSPYGDRMSAIIEATTVRPLPERYYELGLNVFHTSGLAAIPFEDGRGNVLVSARRGNIADLARLAENDFGEPNYADGFARVDYAFTDATRLAFNTLMSRDEIVAITSSHQQRARVEYRNIYGWLTLDHDWSERARTRVIASFTDLVNERHGVVDEPGARVGQVRDDRTFHIAGLRIENDIDTDVIKHRFGAEVRELWGDYKYDLSMTVQPDFPFPGSPGSQITRTLSPAPEGYESSAYWDGRIELDEHWMLQAGARIDTQTYDGSDDGEHWSPRLSVLYSLSPDTHLRASWGRYYQFQGINELQVEDGVQQFYQAQHADHTIVSFDHAFDAGYDLRVEAYRKYYRRINPRFENLFDPLVLFPEAEFDRVMIDAPSARAEGVEVLFRMRPRGAWSGWASYTWSRANDRIDGTDVPRSWDQRHAANVGVVWAKGPWTATMINSFHTGWPTTQLQITTASGTPQIVLSERNRSRFRYYNSLDFRVTRTLILPRGALDVFVEASNTFSRRNQCCAEYTVAQNPDGTFDISRNFDSWLPLVPSFGVLWRY